MQKYPAPAKCADLCTPGRHFTLHCCTADEDDEDEDARRPPKKAKKSAPAPPEVNINVQTAPSSSSSNTPVVTASGASWQVRLRVLHFHGAVLLYSF